MITKTKKIKKRKNWEQPVLVTVFTGLTLGLIGLLTFSNFRINQRRAELLNQIGNLDKEIRSLEEINSQLEAGIQETQKDAHWEEKIREQGYKKPGEEQVVILPPSEAPEETPGEEKGLWQRLLDKIGF